VTVQETPVSAKLAEDIRRRCGENAMLCYQCKKCTSGCPVARDMDVAPHRIMRAIQFGRDEAVLNSRTIWLCANCETCFTRCPQSIDIPRIMDAAKNIAKDRGIRCRVPDVATFYNLAVDWINRTGRVYELGLMGEYNLRTGKPARNMDLAIKMFRSAS